jgi:hypothetical protein
LLAEIALALITQNRRETHMNFFQIAITILTLATFITFAGNAGNVGTSGVDNTFANNSIAGNAVDGCPGCTPGGPGS